MNNYENPGLYIHIPFCQTKCPYCNFYSLTSHSLVSTWLEALHKEILLYKDRFARFDSLYLGGGTPTLLNNQELSTLMHYLFQNLAFATDTEITIEANPDDINPDKMALLRDLGFNRISVGVQSFNDQELQYLKRRHTARQTEKALELIRSFGFTNLGIDLIYGFEGQSKNGWLKTMQRGLEFQPEHLSCYQMTLEEDTPFGKMKKAAYIKTLGEEEERAFFLLTSQFLEAQGYIHYEISNFAISKGFCSRHNQKYWHHVPYLGLGPSAHSFQNGIRWWNFSSLRQYSELLSEGEKPVAGMEILSSEQLRLESLYLGFRTRHGVAIEILQYNPQWEKVLSQLQESGLLKVLNDRVLPTREGFVVSERLPLLFSG